MASDGDALTRLADGARGVLDANWLGASTLPSRTLYPHQWNWDSAFIAIGRSWYDEPRAQQELRSLFRAQWADGRVPHIVFNPAVGEDAVLPGTGVLAVVAAVRQPRRATWRRRGSPSRPSTPAPRSRCTATRATSRHPAPSSPGCIRSSSPSTTTSTSAAARRDRRCRCSCTRGSPGSTTRPPGIVTWPSWSSRRARSRPTSATTSTTRTPPIGRPTRPTTGSCSSRPRIARLGYDDARLVETRCRSSSPARCSTRSTCGRRMRWRTSPRSSAPTRSRTERTRSGSTTRS